MSDHHANPQGRGRRKKPTINDIFAAWLFDRAEQYDNSSCCRAVFDELIGGARQGIAQEDFEHGDLDDILRRWGFEMPQGSPATSSTPVVGDVLESRDGKRRTVKHIDTTGRLIVRTAHGWGTIYPNKLHLYRVVKP